MIVLQHHHRGAGGGGGQSQTCCMKALSSVPGRRGRDFLPNRGPVDSVLAPSSTRCALDRGRDGKEKNCGGSVVRFEWSTVPGSGRRPQSTLPNENGAAPTGGNWHGTGGRSARAFRSRVGAARLAGVVRRTSEPARHDPREEGTNWCPGGAMALFKRRDHFLADLLPRDRDFS